MPRRKLADYGYEETRPHLRFTVLDLDLLSWHAHQNHMSMSEWIERIVRAWCVERRALDKAQALEEDRIDAMAKGAGSLDR